MRWDYEPSKYYMRGRKSGKAHTKEVK